MTNKHYRKQVAMIRGLTDPARLDLSQLRPEHIDVLQEISRGLTLDQIAVVLNRRRTALNSYTHRMRQLTGCQSLVQLVCEALRQKLIQ